jgi:hypothetical protein
MDKSQKTNNPYLISYENAMDTNAATECTGLIYQAAEDGKEWETYQEIYNFSTPRCPQSSSPANKQSHKSQDK